MRAEAELLVDRGDAAILCFPRREVVDNDAIERDRAGIGLEDAGDKVDPRALARAVLADQAVNLSCQDLKGDAVQNDVAGERLGEPVGLEHWPALALGTGSAV